MKIRVHLIGGPIHTIEIGEMGISEWFVHTQKVGGIWDGKWLIPFHAIQRTEEIK